MFPYVCLATMFLFLEPNWPRKINPWKNSTEIMSKNIKNKKFLKSCGKTQSKNNIKSVNQVEKRRKISFSDKSVKGEMQKFKKRIVLVVLLFHFLLQLFLPYSHFITKVNYQDESKTTKIKQEQKYKKLILLVQNAYYNLLMFLQLLKMKFKIFIGV